MAKSYSAGTLEVGLLTTANEVSKVFSALNAELRTTQRLVSAITGNKSKIANATGNTKTSSSGGAFGFLKVAKWSSVLFMARRIGKAVSTIAQAGANYTETLNLWETSMGTNVTLANEFVKKMNEAYGISEKTLMNAQATFKNMLGGLGNISQQTAYALSEGITQMAVDYASLYNVTFEQAFTKFQAALAGQVRPIRSVSGFDITEQTLFSLYQQLGGEKTMRQLNRTEKQLLSILAIFQQMEATGTTGDLRDTMDSFANQSRVMAENMQRVSSYAGILVTHWIQQKGLLVNINAILIFLGDTLLAVAEATGAIEHYADPFGEITNGALEASKATDELNGKLLDFDKFRALNESSDTNALGLDEKLLNALSGYETILKNAKMEATGLAKNLKIASGLFNEDGTFNIERWEQLVDTIESFGYALLAIISSKVITGVVKGIMSITLASKSLSNVLLTGVIYAILEAIDAFRDGEYVAGALATAIGVTLLGAFISMQRKGILKTIKSLQDYIRVLLISHQLNTGSYLLSIVTLTGAFVGLGSAIFGAFAIINSWADMNNWQKIIGVVGVATTAILGLAMAFGAFHSAWSLGFASAGIVAGIGAIVASIATIKKDVKIDNYANGGLPDKGTVFRAGEAGAEIVYNTPSGQSGVANIKQIEQAMYGALVRYGNSNGGADQHTVVKIGEDEVFNAVTKSAKRRGLSFTKV